MAAEADALILTCSQNEQTRGLVDKALLAACKPGVLIVNVARGEQLPAFAPSASWASLSAAWLARAWSAILTDRASASIYVQRRLLSVSQLGSCVLQAGSCTTMTSWRD